MSVSAFLMFVLSCVYVTALRRADPPFKESYGVLPTVYRIKDLSMQPGRNKIAVETLITPPVN
jgi:hypothetical protein